MRREIHEKIKYKKGFYCPAPFMHTTANVSKNSIKMCCEGRYTKSQLSEKSSGIPANKRLKEFFYNDKQLLEIRENLLKGEEPLECHVCGDRERNGWSSDRLDYLKKYDHITPDLKYGNRYKQPLSLDIRPGNVCNLKCRMCDPGNSSEISKELQQNPNLNQYYDPYRNREDLSSNMDIINFLSDIDFKLIDDLAILGGEPTVDPDTIAFLEKLIEEGNTNLKLNITSNCTNFNKHWQLFKQFNKLNVCASLDGVGKTYDYIRTNAKWDSVLQNINQLQTLPNLVHLSINVVVQMYNIFDVKEWARFFYNMRKDGDPEERASVGAAYIQACYDPPHFHPSILFEEDKKFIIKEINDLIKEENIKDEEFIERTLTPVQTCLNDPIWNQFEPNAYPAMKPNSVEELRHHFKKHTRMQDKIRNTSAVESLHPRIKKYLI